MKKTILLILLTIPFFVLSCTDDEQIKTDTLSSEVSTNKDNDGMIVLGEKFENPYSVENMKAVYNEMVKTRSGGENVTIEATD